jgi:hypothetical protein
MTVIRWMQGPRRVDVAFGSKPEKLLESKCFPLFTQ